MDSRDGSQTTSSIVIMPSDVVFECPNCGKSMVIDESATGKIVECQQCGTNVIVPPKMPVLPPVEQPVSISESPPPPAPTPEVEVTAPETSVIVSAAPESAHLIPQSADVNAAKPSGATAVIVAPARPVPPYAVQRELASESLLLAAEKGDAILLNKTLEQGADVNAAKADGTTALMLAVQQGNRDSVQTLINHGADLEGKRRDGQTALMLAGQAGNFQILRMLWKAGAKRPTRFFGLRRRGR